jgi:hypothetical protein
MRHRGRTATEAVLGGQLRDESPATDALAEIHGVNSAAG